MNFFEYQNAVNGFRKYPNPGENLEYPTLGFCGEAGEIANKVKKIQRDMGGVITPEMRKAILDEAGDALWYLAAIISELNASMEDVALANVDKLNGRVARGTICGSGDNR